MPKITGNTTATPIAVPKKLSDLENDMGFLTEIPDGSDEDVSQSLKNIENYGDANIYPSDENLFLFTKTQSPNGEQYATIYGLSDEYDKNPISKLVIPYEYEGLPVTMIGTRLEYEEIDGEWCDEWYPYPDALKKGREHLTEIILPDSLRYLECYFDSCVKLKKVRFSRNADVPSGAFMNCSSIEEIELPEGQRYLGSEMFSGCSSLKEIKIPSSVTEIVGSGIFKGCNSLVLRLSDNIVNIKQYGDETIGFEDVKAIVISPDNDYLKEALKDYNLYFDYTAGDLGSDESEDILGLKNLNNYGDSEICPSDLSLFTFEISDDGTYAILTGLSEEYEENYEDLLVIPYEYNGLPVRQIGINNERVFTRGEMDITNIIIPNSVTVLGVSSFALIEFLSYVRFSENLTELPSALFDGCIHLRRVDVPNSVKHIRNRAFVDCSSLKEVSLPEGLLSVGADAFNGCENLDLYIPGSVTYIETDGLEDLKSITIPASSTYLRETLAEYSPYILGFREGDFASKQDIGDISSALDELHNYAVSLAGGEA